MNANCSAIKTPSMLKAVLATSSTVLALICANSAHAAGSDKSATQTIAKGARACVTSGACSATPTTKAFGGAVRSMDRLGWEIGRTMSMNKYGPAGDPGKYPGLRR